MYVFDAAAHLSEKYIKYRRILQTELVSQSSKVWVAKALISLLEAFQGLTLMMHSEDMV